MKTTMHWIWWMTMPMYQSRLIIPMMICRLQRHLPYWHQRRLWFVVVRRPVRYQHQRQHQWLSLSMQHSRRVVRRQLLRL
jgi:hypothetical protein